MSAVQQVLVAEGVTPPAAPGEVIFTSSGTWTCPAGVTSVSVVAVGRGFRSGGALAYTNNITVVPGTQYTITITDGSDGYSGFASSPRAGAGNGYYVPGSVIAGTGGQGGSMTYTETEGGGGGAGGYSGGGGDTGQNGSGGGGAGGAGSNTAQGNGGGGVGIFGQGSSGVASALGGGGGSGGAAGTAAAMYNPTNNGGNYGGGSTVSGQPSNGAVRIIWPGNLRQFPSTRTAYE